MNRAIVTRLQRLEAVAAAEARASWEAFMETVDDLELDAMTDGNPWLDDLTDDELDRLADADSETAAGWASREAEIRAFVARLRGQA